MDDQHDLTRFVRAQERDYEQALSEIGSPDDLKLRFSATLFATVLPPGSVFDRLLAKYYARVRDPKTLHLLQGTPVDGV